MSVGNLILSGGVLSWMTLVIKSFYTAVAVLAFSATTPWEDLGAGLTWMKVPKEIVISLMLTYRYLILLLNEVQKTLTAYAIRSNGKAGVKIGSWGVLPGYILLRSIDRSKQVYDSMALRGFKGEFYYGQPEFHVLKNGAYFLLWCAVFVGLNALGNYF